MGLFDVEQTEDALAAAIKRQKQALAQLKRALQQALLEGGKLVWAFPGKSPQEVCDAYGTDAAALFNVAAKTRQFLFDITGEEQQAVQPDGYDVTVNPDGTVTITAAE